MTKTATREKPPSEQQESPPVPSAAGGGDLSRLVERQEANRPEVNSWRHGFDGSTDRIETYYDPQYPWPQVDPDRLSPLCSFLVDMDRGESGRYVGVDFLEEEYNKGMYFYEPAQNVTKASKRDKQAKDTRGRFLKGVQFDGTYYHIRWLPDRPTRILNERRKGNTLFFDDVTGRSLFCLAANCFAKAMTPELVQKYPQHEGAVNTGYCSLVHMYSAQPELQPGSIAGQIQQAFGTGVTQLN